MKITFVLLLVGLMQVSASTYSQNTKLTLNLKNVKMTDLFEEIEKNSEFRFFYDSSEIDLLQKVTVDLKKSNIEQILNAAFLKTGLSYELIDRHIIVKNTRSNTTFGKISEAQQKSVTGKVTDQSGQPLPGVTVLIKGTTRGTVTNANGEYSLSDIPDGATLQISFVGMLTQEIAVGTQATIDIIMHADVIGIEEVVAVGYGTQKKINLTGALDVVTADEIANRGVTTVTEALQGVSPNLNISASAFSAEPGGKMNLNIRGVGSLSGDYSPYVLVDGVPTDLNLINPEDIESITILKDAAASAIYGARAPYGVILVTTKKGQTNEKVRISYSNNISLSSPLGLPHMSNALKYATAFDQASVNAGLSPNFTPENYDRIRQYMAGEITDETWLKPDGSDWMGNGIWSLAGNGNNDWMYIYYKDKVLRQKHDVNISGGDSKNSFFVSAGYLDQPGELRYGDESYKRYNVTANIVSKPTKWLTFSLNSKYIGEKIQYFTSGYGGGQGGRAVMYHNFYRTNAFRPRVLPNGEFSDISNIDILENGGKENYNNSHYIVSLGANIEPIKDWNTKISYNYKNNVSRRNVNEPTVWGTFPDGTRYAHAYPLSSYTSSFNSDAYQLFNVVSSYNKTFKGHYFSVLGGYEYELDELNGLWGQKKNMITSSVPSISTSTGEHYLSESKSHWATMGIFGRFNYNYKEKYLFEINGRYDGSSKFGEASRWGFFPSISAAYNISKEEFWSDIEPYVNSLKIRASWGSLGNQNVPNYLYLPTMGIQTNSYWITGNERPNYTTAPGIVSADLTWETSSTKNIGLDASFLNNRLTTNLDIYDRETSDMFGPSNALPRLLGTAVPKSNNATLQTRGFELTISWKDKIGNDLSYNVRATLSDNVSTVKEYNNPTKTLSTWREGQKLGEIWGLETVGIYQTDDEAQNGPDQTLFWPAWGAGDIHYKDLDGDNKITNGSWTTDDSGDYKVIGNNSPRFNVGLSTGLTWKGFDFNMFWQGTLKRDYAFSGGDMSFFGFNGHQWWGMNVFEQTEDYWRPADETNELGPNTNAYYTKPYLSQQDYKNKKPQTRFVQNASYIRLKNLSVGYTIPSSISEKLSISKARIFISGENLLTITSLTTLMDPEALSNTGWGVGKVHPLRQVYSMGINVTF